jgi:hypothetical protein
MITAIHRETFIKLFLFNTIKVNVNSIIDIPVDELNKQKVTTSDYLVHEFDRIMPYFEETYELLFLELDNISVQFVAGNIEFPFFAVKRIFPLVTEDLEYLKGGKINPKLILGMPLLEQFVKEVRYKRALRSRISAAKKLIEIFDFADYLSEEIEFKKQLENASINFLKSKPKENDFLSHLLTYDKNPSFIADGNAGILTKIGLVTYEMKKIEQEKIKESIFYKQITLNKAVLNKGTFIDGFYNFKSINKDELREAYQKLSNLIKDRFSEDLDIFKISYFYISIKDYLQKNENDLVSIAQMIYDESRKDPISIYHVLLLIGYTFSFENLYESIYVLSNAPVIKGNFEFKKESKKEYSFNEQVSNLAGEASIETVNTKKGNQKVKVSTESTDLKDKTKTIEEDKPETIISDLFSQNKIEIKDSSKIGKQKEIKDLKKFINDNNKIKDKERWIELLEEHFLNVDKLYFEDIVEKIKKDPKFKNLKAASTKMQQFFLY